MAGFAGWEMPLWYPAGQSAEHHATRKACGLFDICHMGEFEISGPGSLEFLNRMLTNNVRRAEDNQAMYHFMLNEAGGVVDDCILYRFGAEGWMLVVNAGNIRSDFDWLKQHAPESVTLKDISDDTAKIDLQGPNAPKLLTSLAGEEALKDLRFFRCLRDIDIEGKPVLVSRTGYTGEIGFELYTDAGNAEALWSLLLDKGAGYGILPCGLGARDSLRTEAGLPLHGHEIHPDRVAFGHPWEFVFDWDQDFIGKQAVENKRQSEQGPFIYPFRMSGRRKAMPGWQVLKNNQIQGQVLSGVIAPSLENTPIGFLQLENRAEPDTVLSFKAEGRENALEGEICTSPFVPPTSRKKMLHFLS